MKFLKVRNKLSKIAILLTLLIFANIFNPAFATAESKATILKPHPQYGEHEVVSVEKVEYKTINLEPTGQPINGINIKSGGYIYISGAGKSIDVSINVSWGILSATFNNAATGVRVDIPAGNNYYKVILHKKIKVERHKVDVYVQGTYSSTYYTNHVEELSDSYEAIRV